jgi:hypothetical protein
MIVSISLTRPWIAKTIWRLIIAVALVAAALLGQGLASRSTASATGAACGLSVRIIAAPFAVTDSNMPGAQGPRVATIGARLTNTGSAPASPVLVSIGNGTTPGSFPNGLALLTGSPATYTIAELPPGASTTAYWPVTYPPTFDVGYNYTIWAASPDGCTGSASSVLTTQREISATANKLQPTGASILVYPSSVGPGGLITVRVNGFDLGTIGQGPRKDYDAWLQPIGNLDFDPTCLRLVRSEVRLNSLGLTVIDQLYFSGLTAYRGDPSDYVSYTFLALRSCRTSIRPYQEAASGTQEKYNGDFESNSTTVAMATITEPHLTIGVQASPQTPHAGDTIQFAIAVTATNRTVGSPNNGSAVVIHAGIPAQTTYVAGSVSSAVAALVRFSADGGRTWLDQEPASPASVTNLQWTLQNPVTATASSVGYRASIAPSYGGGPITATAETHLQGEPALASSTVVINPTGAPTPTPTPTATPTPEVGGGTSGGLESGPVDAPPSAFIGGVGTQSEPAAAASAGDGQATASHKARLMAAPMSFTLADLLPETGPAGTTRSEVVPVDVLAITTAPDAKAVDFVDATGKVRAVALGIQTLDRPYEHDYGVCNRFKEYNFDSILPLGITGLDQTNPGATTWFWHARSEHGANIQENAFTFHVFVDEAGKTFHIDSRWIQDGYPAVFDFHFDTVFALQVWSNNATTSQELLAAIINKLYQIEGGAWRVTFHNTTRPADPLVFIRGVSYQGDAIRLSLVNRMSAAATVNLNGSWRSYTDRNTLTPLAYRFELQPGETTLTLPFPGLLDATLYQADGVFTDKVYTGGGLWFSFSRVATAKTQLTTQQCRNLVGLDLRDLLLAGCIQLAGTEITGTEQVGLGRTLNPNGRPVDVSPYQAVRFWATGNGSPVRLLIETGDITDGDYYQVEIKPTANWREFLIPLSQFKQRGFGVARPFASTGVKALIWMNADNTGSAFDLTVDQVTFTNHSLLQVGDAAPDGPATAPRVITATVSSTSPIQQMRIFYSLDDGATYTPTAMVVLPAAAAGIPKTFTGQIPGQPLGSEVLYYLEALDDQDYTSRGPLDAPRGVYRYRVDDRPGKLVDDFGGVGLANRLGGTAGLFNNPAAGGALRAYRLDGQLVLDYDVQGADQYAGYFSQLGQLPAGSYNTLDILLRGANGGEAVAVGLRDATGREPRISVGDLLPGGITTEWQWVQIPLGAFPAPLDLNNLTSVSLTFYNAYAPQQGRVYIKEFRLTALAAPIVIDNFDDGDAQINARGLGHWTAHPDATLNARHVAGDAQMPTGYALRLDYDVRPGGYALWASELGGAAAAADARLTFWVKGENMGLLPNLYLTDSSQRARVALGDYVQPKAAWQFVAIPLSAFTAQGLNPADLRSFQVAFEWGSGSGALWLDGITIGAAGAPQAGRRTLWLNDQDSRPLALHLPGGDGWQITSDSPWLTVQGSGHGPASLKVWSVPFWLAPGRYTGRLTARQGAGAAETVTVNLTVTKTLTPKARLFLPLVAGPAATR